MSKCQELCEVLAFNKSVLALCEKWGIAPVFFGDGINFPATIKRLAQYALEEDTK